MMFEDMDDIQGLDDFQDEEFEKENLSFLDENDMEQEVYKIVAEASPVDEGGCPIAEGYRKLNEEIKKAHINETDLRNGIPVSINVDALFSGPQL